MNSESCWEKGDESKEGKLEHDHVVLTQWHVRIDGGVNFVPIQAYFIQWLQKGQILLESEKQDLFLRVQPHRVCGRWDKDSLKDLKVIFYSKILIFQRKPNL